MSTGEYKRYLKMCQFVNDLREKTYNIFCCEDLVKLHMVGRQIIDANARRVANSVQNGIVNLPAAIRSSRIPRNHLFLLPYCLMKLTKAHIVL